MNIIFRILKSLYNNERTDYMTNQHMVNIEETFLKFSFWNFVEGVKYGTKYYY